MQDKNQVVIKSLDVQFLGGGGGVSPAGHPPGFVPDLQKSYKIAFRFMRLLFPQTVSLHFSMSDCIEKKAFRHFNGILMASQSSQRFFLQKPHLLLSFRKKLSSSINSWRKNIEQDERKSTIYKIYNLKILLKYYY